MARSKAIARKTHSKVEKKKKLASQKILRKSAPVVTDFKKKRKFKPGKNAIREIKHYQKSTELLMQRAPFQRKGNLLL